MNASYPSKMHLTLHPLAGVPKFIYNRLIRKEQVMYMGYLLLALFFILETALAIVTLTKQKEKVQWLRNRILTRGCELLFFLLALLLPWAAWDFRFQLCFFVLLIRAGIALAVFLMKRRRASGRKSGINTVLSALGNILLLSLSLIPAFLFTGYEGLETTGPYTVKQASAILVDHSRLETFETDGSYREVPVYFYYPDTENENSESGHSTTEDSHSENVPPETGCPLILFSHGAFGYYQSNTSTYMELASHGYVVVSLDHPYHSFFTRDTAGSLITVNPGFLQDVMLANEDTASEEDILEMSHGWLSLRTEDIGFVLDSLKETRASAACTEAWFFPTGDTADEILDILKMMDTDKIGVMGHSLGGAASVTVGRSRNDIDAVIDLDGTMLGEQLAYENGTCLYYEEAYPVPLLSIDNESHYLESLKSKKATILYVNNVVLDNAPDSRHTYFRNSGHMNFTDLPLFSPALSSLLGTGTVDETECIRTMNAVILQYFDFYLKGRGELTIKESY
ncbi:MAG TPA: hypothetical protein DCZ91_23155 [Lachnospiraceae bacterium]|nr:hypothetical protein [Lachnospiraceae bacterium]